MKYSELYNFVGKDGIDGFFIFYTAILNGMDVQRMPGQLLLINNHRAPDSKTSFVHSVAQSTRLSTTTFVLQKRFRRVLFQQAKVSMPKAATFSFSSRKDPVKYANKIGYPVTVKEVFGENPSFSIRGVQNKKELFSAMRKVRRHLPVNSPRAPSSYAQTINLGSAETVDEDKRIKSHRSRFIVEKQLDGDFYRVYVIGGRASFVVKFDSNSLQVVESPSSSINRLAETAVASVPGIKNAAVDIVEDENKSVYLTEFSERLLPPVMSVEEDFFSNFGQLYQSLLEYEIGLVNGTFSSRRKRATYVIEIKGVSNIPKFTESFLALVNALRLEQRVSETCNIFGKIKFQISGSCFDVAIALENLLETQNITHLQLCRKRIIKKYSLF
ncbi:hypothetical protein [Vreelandella alkaliphila]|uniref:ATP-grasp domain-containing protein n=1 Tax=Vreelandella alkaliphila TaxID=272774 RepID=A0A7C9JX88_9GAMM|nr:hypothetical protein [Halomonas alkaliphila]NDL70386.1 hypothetical protein [Halomonas alkaliphila]